MYANSARKICSTSSTSSWIRFSPLNVSSWLNACVFVFLCEDTIHLQTTYTWACRGAPPAPWNLPDCPGPLS